MTGPQAFWTALAAAPLPGPAAPTDVALVGLPAPGDAPVARVAAAVVGWRCVGRWPGRRVSAGG